MSLDPNPLPTDPTQRDRLPTRPPSAKRVRRRHLPHWDVAGAIYFITSCLAGSIPAQGLLDLERSRLELARRRRPVEISPEAWKIRCWKQLFARRDRWLDCEPAVRHLADARLAQEVVESVYFFAGQRYDLLAYVVMPSHLHWVIRPWDAAFQDTDRRSPREQIMHSLSRHTARQCNRHLGRRGTFWQDESYDHCVRDDEELERIIQYIELNPVRAGLAARPEDYPYSSARDRLVYSIPIGQILPRRTGS